MKLVMEKAGKYLILENNKVIGKFFKIVFKISDSPPTFRSKWILAWKNEDGDYPYDITIKRYENEKLYTSIKKLCEEYQFDNYPGPLKVMK